MRRESEVSEALKKTKQAQSSLISLYIRGNRATLVANAVFNQSKKEKGLGKDSHPYFIINSLQALWTLEVFMDHFSRKSKVSEAMKKRK